MTTVKRIDLSNAPSSKPVRLPNGWLRVDGLLTRIGIFLYNDDTKADGIRREYRPPEEVFAPESLASFEQVPVTDEHPDEFLDAENSDTLSRGNVGDTVKQTGDYVGARLMVTSKALVAKIEKGDAQEISCGYTCDLEQTPGKTAAGEVYDCIQRNIRGNHVAIVPRGRAGPVARVRLDGAAEPVVRNEAERKSKDAPGSPNPQPKATPMTFKRQIQNVDVEFVTEAGAQTFARYDAEHAGAISAMQAKIDAAEKKASEAAAAADAAKEALKKKDEEIKTLPEKLRAEAKERADLEHQARSVLGKKVTLEKLDNDGVRLVVLEKLKVKISDERKKDSAYLTARFDAELERFDAEADDSDRALTETRRKLEPVENEDDDNVDSEDEEDEDDDEGDDRVDSDPRARADKAREKMIANGQQAWQQTAKRHKIA